MIEENVRVALSTLRPTTLASGTAEAEVARWLLGGPKPCGLVPSSPLAAQLLARGALITHDWALWKTARAHLIGDRPEERLLLVWQRICAGDAPADVVFRRLGDACRVLGRGDLVAETEALRAWAASERDASRDALSIARRAYWMSRSEELPFPIFLASLVLARVRRLVGEPERGVKILSTIRRFAPAPWHLWLDAELALCRGGPEGARPWLESARFPASEPFARDRRRVLEALGRLPLQDPLIRAWAHGERDEVPYGLQAFADVEGVVAYAVGHGHHPRRLLGVSRETWTAMGVRLLAPRHSRRPARSERVLAALLLAGPRGCSPEGLFQRAYGARYVDALHRSVLDVQLHRCRALLGEQGTILRDPARITLLPNVPMAVRDPRCERRADERVLRLLRIHGCIDARSASVALGLSRRAASSLLRRLAEGPLCEARRGPHGHLRFEVEDSAFESPTQTSDPPAWVEVDAPGRPGRRER